MGVDITKLRLKLRMLILPLWSSSLQNLNASMVFVTLNTSVAFWSSSNFLRVPFALILRSHWQSYSDSVLHHSNVYFCVPALIHIVFMEGSF